MGRNENISGSFILVFFIAAFGISAFNMWQIRGEVERRTPASDIIKGQWASMYENIYNENVSTFDLSKNIWGVINYALYEEGMQGVLIGDDGWLFTSEEFEYQENYRENFKINTDFIIKVAQHFEDNNINLVIAPVPAKSRVYENNLGRYNFPAYKDDIYASFVQKMENRNIIVADVLPKMLQKDQNAKHPALFLKTDTHWTPQGAKLSAQYIAKTIQKNFADKNFEEKKFAIQKVDSKKLEGDLTRYIPVEMFQNIKAENIAVYETAAMQDDAKDGADMSSMLFDDSTPEIALVGTSYSADENWNFEGFLKASLKIDILNAADKGLGPFETMLQYLDNKAFKENPPKLVIWEIPERYLTFSYPQLGTTEFNQRMI
ncbi:MAG: alginate O-acetyltransferase AlgX-related protein [Alphaproteobacteria bacterium]